MIKLRFLSTFDPINVIKRGMTLAQYGNSSTQPCRDRIHGCQIMCYYIKINRSPAEKKEKKWENKRFCLSVDSVWLYNNAHR